MHVPVNHNVILEITSKDVIHSVAIQAMRIGQDAIPGSEIPIWFKPVKIGTYEIVCAQLCGSGPLRDAGNLVVDSEADYKSWLNDMEQMLPRLPRPGCSRAGSRGRSGPASGAICRRAKIARPFSASLQSERRRPSGTENSCNRPIPGCRVSQSCWWWRPSCSIFLGGMVTSMNAGLSVPDWPTSYGYNMFTFPITRWVGGIFFEHTHRLLATCVGMMTTVLVAWIWRNRWALPVALQSAWRRPAAAIIA